MGASLKNILPAIVGKISFFFAILAALSIFLMMFLVSFEVFTRKVFGWSTLIAHDLSGFFLVAIIFFGAAQTLRMNKHLRVTFILNALKGYPNLIFQYINIIISICFIAVLIYSTFLLVMDSYDKNSLTSGVVQFQKYIPQALMPIGLAVLFFQLVVQLVQLRNKKDVE